MEHIYKEDEELCICKVCRLMEGDLTTDCCGEPVSMNISDEIYAGRLDYRDSEGGWVNKLNPTNQSVLYGRIFAMITKRTEIAAKNKFEIMLSFGIDKEQYKEVEKKVIRDIYKYTYAN